MNVKQKTVASRFATEGGFTAVPNVLMKFKSELGLTNQEHALVLVILSFQYGLNTVPCPTRGDISARLGLSKSRISAIKADLIAKGMIRTKYKLGHRGVTESSEWDLTPILDKATELNSEKQRTRPVTYLTASSNLPYCGQEPTLLPAVTPNILDITTKTKNLDKEKETASTHADTKQNSEDASVFVFSPLYVSNTATTPKKKAGVPPTPEDIEMSDKARLARLAAARDAAANKLQSTQEETQKEITTTPAVPPTHGQPESTDEKFNRSKVHSDAKRKEAEDYKQNRKAKEKQQDKPAFGSAIPPKDKNPLSSHWRFELAKKLPSSPPPNWQKHQHIQLANVSKQYGEEATEGMINFFIRNWDYISKKWFKGEASVPTLTMFVKLHESISIESHSYLEAVRTIRERDTFLEENPDASSLPGDLMDRVSNANKVMKKYEV